MKYIIAGTRDIDMPLYNKVLYEIIERYKLNISEIISGCARGVDYLGECYSQTFQLKLNKKPADWDKYKKAAGVIRNREMAVETDEAIILWDGKSRGTFNMMEEMKKLNKPFYLAIIKDENDIKFSKFERPNPKNQNGKIQFQRTSN